jgi:kynurenine 3-monooxygenase
LLNKEKITLIGAGLAGPLLANYMAQRGYVVTIIESRPDRRKVPISAGRSINLALSARGIHALKEIGLYDRIKPITIPMRGRMIHDLDGTTHLLPYGQTDDEIIFSIWQQVSSPIQVMNHPSSHRDGNRFNSIVEANFFESVDTPR